MPLTQINLTHSAGGRKNNSGRSWAPCLWLKGSLCQPESEWTVYIVVGGLPLLKRNRAIPGNPKCCWNPGQGASGNISGITCLPFEDFSCVVPPRNSSSHPCRRGESLVRCHRTSMLKPASEDYCMFEENLAMCIGGELTNNIYSLLRHAIKLVHLHELYCSSWLHAHIHCAANERQITFTKTFH